MPMPDEAVRAATDVLPYAVALVDADGIPRYGNRLARRLLGELLDAGLPLPWPGIDDLLADAAAQASSPQEQRAADWLPSRPTIVVTTERGDLLRIGAWRLEDAHTLLTFSARTAATTEDDPARRLAETEAIAHIGWWSWDVQADVVTWSDEVWRLHGCEPGSVPLDYARVLQDIHPDDEPRQRSAVKACLETGRPYDLTYRSINTADGTMAWRRGRGRAVTVDGRPVRLFGTVQDVTDQVLAQQALQQSLDEERRLRAEIERLRAEISAQLDEVRALRARIVAAADEARRRLERDLHDGAQQRLTTAGLLLSSARTHVPGDASPRLSRAIDAAVEELEGGLADLRSLARGLHPTLLAEHGLVPATEALAARAPLPVAVHCEQLDRLPARVETAAYFVIAEALTNAVKHAQAQTALVDLTVRDERLLVQITDDGRGGATLHPDGGLCGLLDRVAAVDGEIDIDSPAGHGTRLRAELPCA